MWWSKTLSPGLAPASNISRWRRWAKAMPTAEARPEPERPGGDLDALGVVDLGVAGGEAAPRAQRLQVGQLEAVAGEVELDVLGEAGVPAREHEPVAAEPRRVGRVVGHEVLVEQVGHGRQRHRGAGVAVADLLDRVGREQPHQVDRADVLVGPPGLLGEGLRELRAALREDGAAGGSSCCGRGHRSSPSCRCRSVASLALRVYPATRPATPGTCGFPAHPGGPEPSSPGPSRREPGRPRR